MACFSGPEIVNDGLVLHLDAANKLSYPGTGTTWYDLRKNYNATLVNGATISSGASSLEYAGAVYDFSNDYVLVDSTELNKMSYPWTMLCWFNLKEEGHADSYQTLALMGCSGTSPTGIGKQLGIGGGSRLRKPWALVYDSNGAQRTLGSLVGYGQQYEFDKWYMTALTHDGTTAKIYVNDYVESQISIDGYSPYPSNTTQKFTIGLNRIYFHFGGLISIASVYNRALSDNEIQQNFEATRSRYGI